MWDVASIAVVQILCIHLYYAIVGSFLTEMNTHFSIIVSCDLVKMHHHPISVFKSGVVCSVLWMVTRGLVPLVKYHFRSARQQPIFPTLLIPEKLQPNQPTVQNQITAVWAMNSMDCMVHLSRSNIIMLLLLTVKFSPEHKRTKFILHSWQWEFECLPKYSIQITWLELIQANRVHRVSWWTVHHVTWWHYQNLNIW